MPTLPATRDRYSFANLDEALSLPDLISIQRDSFEWLLAKWWRGYAIPWG